MINYWEWNIYQRIFFVSQNVQVFIGSLGIISNVFTICVFLRPTFKKHAYSFYSIFMCFSNICMLTHTFRHWSRLVLDFNIDLSSAFFCKFNEYLVNISICSSLWLLGLISIDRLLTIVYPGQFQIMKKRCFQLILVFVIFTLSSLAYIKMPFEYTIRSVESTSSTKNITVCFLPLFVVKEIGLINTFNTFSINIVINFTVHFKVIHYIYSSRKKTFRSTYRRRILLMKDRQFAFSSIGLNMTAFLCNIPLQILHILMEHLTLNKHQLDMISAVAITIAIVDNSFVFLVNMLFNSIFYRELLVMLGLRKVNF